MPEFNADQLEDEPLTTVDTPVGPSRIASRSDSAASDDDDILRGIPGSYGIKYAEEEEDQRRTRQLLILICVVSVVLVLGLVDSFTTQFIRRGAVSCAAWKFEEAPASLLLYQFMIVVLIMCCLPYAPLSYLLGAIVTTLYGPTNGFFIGVLLLFTATMVAAALCFILARHKFKGTVQRRLSRSRNKHIRVLRNLDRLIVDGNAFEMVLLIRFVPLPTAVSQYFLGTTSVTWIPFLAANACVSLLFACTDILIGMGAAKLRADNPGFVVGFLVLLGLFCAGILWLGWQMKKKLETIEDKPERRVRKASFDLGIIEEA